MSRSTVHHNSSEGEERGGGGGGRVKKSLPLHWRQIAGWSSLAALFLILCATAASFLGPSGGGGGAIRGRPRPPLNRNNGSSSSTSSSFSLTQDHRVGHRDDQALQYLKPTLPSCPFPLDKSDYALCDCCFFHNATTGETERISNEKKKLLMMEQPGVMGVNNCELRMKVLAGRHPSHFCLHSRHGSLRTDCILTELINQIFYPEENTAASGGGGVSSDASSRSNFFIEAGASDGVDGSTTHFFQAKRNWGGLLVEGSTKYFPKAQKNRQQDATIKVVKLTTTTDAEGGGGTSQVLTTIVVPEVKIVHAAVCGLGAVRRGSSLPFYDKAGKGRGGIVDYYDPHFARIHFGISPKNMKRSSGKIHCVSLSDEVMEMNRTHVDFWSLDVVGAEWQALSAFNFSQVTVGVLAIELDGLNPAKDMKCRNLLAAVWGMRFFLRSANDEVWYHPKYASPKGPWSKCYG